jgi:hypothetical protein
MGSLCCIKGLDRLRGNSHGGFFDGSSMEFPWKFHDFGGSAMERNRGTRACPHDSFHPHALKFGTKDGGVEVGGHIGRVYSQLGWLCRRK